MQTMGCKRVALLTDEGIVKAGVVDLIKDLFDVQGSPTIVGIYDKIATDAAGSSINACVRWCRETVIDGIVAVGGGSVLDAAKTVRCMLGMNLIDVWEIMPNLGCQFVGAEAKPLGYPLVAFPTTAGTGAEVSPFSVVYNEEVHMKGLLVHSNLPAEYTFLDPYLTVGLPPKLTAYTGFDALCHAVEALASPASNDMIDGYSFQAIKMIVKYLPIAVQDGKNIEARTKLLVASNMACTAVAMAGGVFPIHNIDHAVGAHFRISHGECNTVLLPCALEQMKPYYLPVAALLADAFGVKKEGMTDEAMLTAVTTKIREMQRVCSVNAKFAPKVDDALLAQLTIAVKIDPSGAGYAIPEDFVKKILNAAFNH
jgi:alcohol dehydrogenase class IV